MHQYCLCRVEADKGEEHKILDFHIFTCTAEAGKSWIRQINFFCLIHVSESFAKKSVFHFQQREIHILDSVSQFFFFFLKFELLENFTLIDKWLTYLIKFRYTVHPPEEKSILFLWNYSSSLLSPGILFPPSLSGKNSHFRQDLMAEASSFLSFHSGQIQHVLVLYRDR
jgi:hypothetical protein